MVVAVIRLFRVIQGSYWMSPVSLAPDGHDAAAGIQPPALAAKSTQGATSVPEAIDYRKTVPVTAETELLVVGGGPAGIAAAVAGARNGARTMLVERYGYLGGNLTAGLVGPCMTSYSLDGEQQLIKGIFEELVLRMEAVGGALHPGNIPAG